MKNMDDARELANIMVQIGNRLGRDTRAVLSDMSEPLGMAVGNSLEVKEAIEALHGNGPKDLMELCFTAGSIMLVQAKCAKDRADARKKLEEVIANGAAFKKFCQMVEAQDGDLSYILHPEKFEVSKNVIELVAEKEGYIKSIDALEIGESSMRLGGGRATIDDVIDMSAGILLNKKVGDFVRKGDKLCTVYTNKDKSAYLPVCEDIKHAFVIVKEHVQHTTVIKEVIEL
jgi:pyrimidine-nucleoside phosphorylase